MSGLLGVSLGDLIETSKAHNLRLPAEIGAFVGLQVCEALLDAPAAVRASEVRVAEDGTLGVYAPPHSASEEDAARAVVDLLRRLLACSGSGIPKGLDALLSRGPSSGRWDLPSLRNDLEASLVPLNRGASRRVLARMMREVRRSRSRAPAARRDPEPAPRPAEPPAPRPSAPAPRAGPEGRGVAPGGGRPVDAFPPRDAGPGLPPATSAAPPPATRDVAPASAVPARSARPSHREPTGGLHAAIDEILADAEPEPPPPLEELAATASSAPPSLRPAGALPQPPNPTPIPFADLDPRAPSVIGADHGELDAELDATLSALAPPPEDVDQPRPVWGRDELADDPDGPTLLDQPSPARLEPPNDAASWRRTIPREPRRPAVLAEPTGVDDLTEGLEAGGGRRSLLGWALAFLAVIAVTAAVIAVMRPDLVDRMLGRPAAPAPDEPTPAEIEARRRADLARYGLLTVRAQPPETQVFLFLGRGPTTAPDLPSGVAHEFLAIGEGRRPSRTVLPADARWERTEDEGLRYELAMQLGPPLAEGERLAPGVTGLPRNVGSPGDLGAVRVVTNPPGAKVYVLVGFSPEVRVENVATEEAVELLLYHPGYAVERLIVGPSDWQGTAEGPKRAVAEVRLTALDPD